MTIQKKLSRRFSLQIAPWATLVWIFSMPLLAEEFIIDQRNEYNGIHGPFWTGSLPLSIGQEFRPASNSVSFVDMLTLGGAQGSATLEVLVHSGTVDGPLAGVSDLVTVTNTASAETNRFRFVPPAQVIPGNTYVMELITTGDGSCSVGASSDTYSRGRMIYEGQPDATHDLWFCEGYSVGAPDGPVLSLQLSHVTLSWSSQTGKTYQIQYRSELTTNTWTNLGPPVAGTGLTNSVVEPIASPRRYYRVIVLPL